MQLDRALAAAAEGFRTWRAVSPYERGKVMRRAVEIIRSRRDEIARLMAMEQGKPVAERSEEHTSELQSLMRISYAVFCLKKKTTKIQTHTPHPKCTHQAEHIHQKIII